MVDQEIYKYLNEYCYDYIVNFPLVSFNYISYSHKKILTAALVKILISRLLPKSIYFRHLNKLSIREIIFFTNKLSQRQLMGTIKLIYKYFIYKYFIWTCQMFPCEIFRLTSLYLPPLALAINHQLHSLYDDTWYGDYLQLNNPDTKLWKQTTYQHLYNKFCRSGRISKYRINFITHLSRQGVAAADVDGQDMILTFNGELYLGDILIDTQVVAINSSTYIKDYEWWHYTDSKWHKIDITPTSSFLKVECSQDYICAMTKDGLYYHNIDDSRYFSYPDIKEITVQEDLLILDSKGDVYDLGMEYGDICGFGAEYGLKKLITKQVDKLFSGGWQLLDGTVQLRYENVDYERVVGKKFLVPGKMSHLQAYWYEFFLLISNNLYYCQAGEPDDKPKLATLPIATKIRQVMGNRMGIYFVYMPDAQLMDASIFDISRYNIITL